MGLPSSHSFSLKGFTVADNLPNVIENALLDALVGTTAYSMTGPVMLALMTANGNDASAGTEVTGGSYGRVSMSMTAASGGSITNSAELNFAGMPTATVVGVELYDSNGSPKRLAYGSLSVSKAVTSGDTLQFAASSVTLSLS